MKINSDKVTNLNYKYLVVKKTSRGYLYYSNYRITGSKSTSYATLYNKEQADKKMADLQSRTKGKFSVISAKEVFCNSWNFRLNIGYGEEVPSITVHNDSVPMERVRNNQVVPKDFPRAMKTLKEVCTQEIEYKRWAILNTQKEIENLQTALVKLEEKHNTFTQQTQTNELETALKQVVDANAVPADTVVAILFGKGDNSGQK